MPHSPTPDDTLSVAWGIHPRAWAWAFGLAVPLWVGIIVVVRVVLA